MEVNKDMIAIRNEVTRALEERYFLLPKSRMYFILGGVSVFLVLTLGLNYAAAQRAAQAAVESTVASKIIEQLKDAEGRAVEVARQLGAVQAKFSELALLKRLDAIESEAKAVRYDLGGAILEVARVTAADDHQRRAMAPWVVDILEQELDETAMFVSASIGSKAARLAIEDERRRKSGQ